MSTGLLIWRFFVAVAVVIVWQWAIRQGWQRLRLRRLHRTHETIWTLPPDVPVATLRGFRATPAGIDWTADLTDEAIAAGVTPADVEFVMELMRIS